jgi:DNA (cytosine-5)-methyltransferase 1
LLRRRRLVDLLRLRAGRIRPYTDDAIYEFASTKTEKFKQIDNAVSVAKMKACVLAIMEDAAPKAGAVMEARAEAAA